MILLLEGQLVLRALKRETLCEKRERSTVTERERERERERESRHAALLLQVLSALKERGMYRRTETERGGEKEREKE